MFIIYWTLVNLVAGDIQIIKTGLNWTESIQECGNNGKVILDKLFLSNNSIVKRLDGQGKMWIGEAVVNNYYWEKGCVEYVDTTRKKDFSKESNLFLNCIKFCQDHSSVIGLRGFNCYCMESTNAQYIPCNSSCVWEIGSSCLQSNSLTKVYKAEKNSTFVQKFKGRKRGRCVTVNTEKRGIERIYWTAKNCNEKQGFICQTHGTTEIEIFKELLTWDNASLSCVSKGLVLAEISSINWKMFKENIPNGYGFWIGLRTVNQIISKTDGIDFRQRILKKCTVVDVKNNIVAYKNESCNERKYFHACVSKIHLTEKNLTEEVVTEENDIKKDVDSIDNSNNEPNNDGTKEMDIQKDVESNNESTENTSNDETSGTIVGIILGVTITILLLLTALVCLLRRFKKHERGGYRAPQVSYSNSNRRESELPEESIVKSQSGKSKPIKPVRRSTKSKSEHTGATTYENIVLTLEDPKAISRVVSMPTKPVNNSKENENNYDVMTRTVSPNSEGHNVYGSAETGNEYDVMDRGFRPVDNNPDYDHV